MSKKDIKAKRIKERCIIVFKKYYTKKWFISIVVFVIFIIFVFVIPIIINELYKFNTGYLTLWSAADVLAFYAEILGSIISIGALIATIHFTKKDTEKQIKFSKAQTNPPYFLISKVYQANDKSDVYELKNGLIWRKEYIVNRYGDNHGQIVITLRNIGEGIALAPCYTISLEKNTNEEVESIFVNKDDYFEIDYNLHEVLKLKYRNPIFLGFEAFDSCITLRYQNTLGIKFIQKINLHHEWNIERNSVVILVNSISPQNIEL